MSSLNMIALFFFHSRWLVYNICLHLHYYSRILKYTLIGEEISSKNIEKKIFF